MDDPNLIPDPLSSEPSPEPDGAPGAMSAREPMAGPAAAEEAGMLEARAADFPVDVVSRRRSFLNNLLLLLSLTLAAFILTAWILVRVDAPFGPFSSGPQEIVRAQLQALDRGELRPAYDMFSTRYRGEVSFEVWHELIVTHWRMFHGEVLRSEQPAKSGPGVSLEIYLRGADDKDYRARFLLIRTDGRWWIDDVHWAVEPDQGEFSRT
ncbi:MAG: hypothetical protein LAO08_20470 [Acidobacteriia bacterium]|nr:hypothetical protein [Terriglobia bacterium]